MKPVLFVCVENSCRSQMAEAFAKLYGKGNQDIYSAGSRPSGKVNEKAIESMREVGYDLSAHRSKSLDDIPDVEYAYAITMGCGDECPHVRAKRRQDWAIPDPKNMDKKDFNAVRDTIKTKVLSLMDSMDREE